MISSDKSDGSMLPNKMGPKLFRVGLTLSRRTEPPDLSLLEPATIARAPSVPSFPPGTLPFAPPK